MKDKDVGTEPPEWLIIIGFLAVVGLLLWSVNYFFTLSAVKEWLFAALGGWAVPVMILFPGGIITWLLKKLVDE